MTGLLPLVLASSSPRRQQLLAELVPVFEVAASGVDEDEASGVPEVVALELAVQKAAVVAGRLAAGWVLGADTVIDLDGELLGKPRDAAHATEMLVRLSGRTHRVLTAVALQVAGTSAPVVTGIVATSVRMRRLVGAEIDAYVASGEPFDKAGAYAIQDLQAALVSGIDGCYNNVVGLPLCEVWRMLRVVGEAWRVADPRCVDPLGIACPRLRNGFPSVENCQ